MLELDTNLPPGALCAADPAAVQAHLNRGIWWHGSEDHMELDPTTSAISLWRACNGGPPCEPTESNAGNGLRGEVDEMIGLQCRAGTHCGMVADDVVTDVATATMAVRFYTPPGEDARTLLTLNAEASGNYLFLSETEGVLTAKDDNGVAEVTLPCPPRDAPRLAIVSLFGDQLALSLGTTRMNVQARQTVLNGGANLFIGCRNQRPRLFKTLGSALILDVWLFTGRALLHSDAPDDTRSLAALKRHHLWSDA